MNLFHRKPDSIDKKLEKAREDQKQSASVIEQVGDALEKLSKSTADLQEIRRLNTLASGRKRR